MVMWESHKPMPTFYQIIIQEGIITFKVMLLKFFFMNSRSSPLQTSQDEGGTWHVWSKTSGLCPEQTIMKEAFRITHIARPQP